MSSTFFRDCPHILEESVNFESASDDLSHIGGRAITVDLPLWRLMMTGLFGFSKNRCASDAALPT